MTASARRAPHAAAGIMTAVSLAGGLACASYSDALVRGQRYYEDNQFERALALWRDLDRRDADFSASERARYAYLRGMTDYRLGYHDDARHWLAIARASNQFQVGGLGAVWLERLDSALIDLGRGPNHSRESADRVQTIEAPPSATSSDDAAGRGTNSLERGPGVVGGTAGPPPAAAGSESGSEAPVSDAGTSPEP